jgi:LuxR family maltose regulon positive regulatory protein
MNEILEHKDFFSRYYLYDLIITWFYVKIGLLHLVPVWVKVVSGSDSSEYGFRIPEILIKARYFLKCKKYYAALAEITPALNANDEEYSRYYIGELEKSVLRAVILYKTDSFPTALAELETAYEMSKLTEFIMPFIELGNDMAKLAYNAKNYDGHNIPREWLENIERLSAAYEKKVKHIAALYKKNNYIEEEIKLSERELQILCDLSLGMSRFEIASSRHLSINTIKTVTQALYNKLGVDNNVAAVKTAIEKNLI